MIPITINNTINLQAQVKQIIAIIFHQYSLPSVQQLIQAQLQYEHELSLIQHHPQHYYIILRVCQQNSFNARKSIERVVGLANEIIGIELDNQKQSLIQSKYLQMINNNINNNYYSLKFVNNTYMKLHERVHENIYYYPDINHIPIHSQQPNKHKHSRMKVIDIVKIYEQCSLMDKETKEVRTIFQGIQKHQHREQLRKKGHSILHSYDKYEIYSKKMEWENMEDKDKYVFANKVQGLKKYNQQKQQEQTQIKEIRIIKLQPIHNINLQAINMWIIQFHKAWTKNTLKELKKYFNAIANRRDSKALNQFRNKYESNINKIREFKEKEPLNTHKLQLILNMEKEVKQFMNYHQEVIKGQFFSSIHYYHHESKYHWKYEPKIYQKGMTLLLIFFLAYLQEDFILGITILSIGLIFSAINF